MRWPRYYTREGEPIDDLLEWGRLFENMDIKCVAETTLPDGTWISTVWLGLDHSTGLGPPLIFETKVFSDEASRDDLDVARYSTEADAKEGHEAMVKRWSTPHAKS